MTDITAFIAVFDGSATGMDILFCVFGTLLFVALALYLIRPAKRQEIDALWADGWSFGDENGRRHAGAKAAAIVSAVLVAAFAAGHCLPIAAAGASSALCSAYLSSRFADFAQKTGRKAAGLLIAAAGAAVIAAL